MKVVQFINPDGKEVSVPESDAKHFEEKGWKRAGSKQQSATENEASNPKDKPSKRGR